MKVILCKFSISCFLWFLISLLLLIQNVYGESYSYDDLGRLTTIRFNGTVTTILRYDYDPVGNITSRTVTTTIQAKEHTLESDHPSFNIIEDGKRYVISLKRGETAEVRVRLLAEDGSANIDETEVTTVTRKVGIDNNSQSTTDGMASFTITGQGTIRGSIKFSTEIGLIKLRVKR